MDGKGPYRIYDPGGSEAKAREDFSYRQLLEENGILRERMKGLKSLGGCFFFWVTFWPSWQYIEGGSERVPAALSHLLRQVSGSMMLHDRRV